MKVFALSLLAIVLFGLICFQICWAIKIFLEFLVKKGFFCGELEKENEKNKINTECAKSDCNHSSDPCDEGKTSSYNLCYLSSRSQKKLIGLLNKFNTLKEAELELDRQKLRDINKKRIHQTLPKIFIGIAMYRRAEKLSLERGADKREILQLLHGAAESGYEEAMTALGNYYSDQTQAKGLEKSRETNFIKARRWYEKAAENGSLDGMEKLARFLEEGIGGDVAYRRAIRLKEKIFIATFGSTPSVKRRTEHERAVNERDDHDEWLASIDIERELSKDLSCLDAVGKDLLGTVENLEKPLEDNLKEKAIRSKPHWDEPVVEEKLNLPKNDHKAVPTPLPKINLTPS